MLLTVKERIYSTKYDDKHVYEEKLNNQLELMRYVKQQQNKHAKLSKPIQKTIDDLAKDWQIASVWIYLWLYRWNWVIFRENVYDDCMNKESKPNSQQYQLNDQTKLIQSYFLFKESKLSTLFKLPEKGYLYDSIPKNGSKQQLLDSSIERAYMKKVKALFSRATEKKETWVENVIWTKNPLAGEIYLEDVLENEKRRIYPDFIYKIHDYYVYVEVKGYGKRDFNPSKTTQVRKIFKNYVEKANKTNHIVFSLVKVYKDYDNFQYENFTKISEINFSESLDKILITLHKLASKTKKNLVN